MECCIYLSIYTATPSLEKKCGHPLFELTNGRDLHKLRWQCVPKNNVPGRSERRELQPARFDFDMIQTALKLTTFIYGGAYLKTTFKVQYLPNEEELMNNISKIIREELIPREEMEKVVKVNGDDNNQWENDLPKSQYRDATMLYSSMKHKIPKMLVEELDRRIKYIKNNLGMKKLQLVVCCVWRVCGYSEETPPVRYYGDLPNSHAPRAEI
ncbi:hypothetical protein DPMN_038582 [Dreissena polymorpha]|uniref:Uncharacterized protein n=1 Tax=Dreissena polymorpha TaxID=45954 RepID=A0A9D4MGK9_DREPO|nr:hypothetical protein DPMN_038582 [Dreissena polymorpha]